MEIFSAIRSSFSYELAPVLFMDFGASKTKVTIIEYGVVKSFHIINRGSTDITRNIATSMNISFKEAEDLKRSVGLNKSSNQSVAQIIEISMDYILSETNAIVQGYQKKYNKAISKIIMMGGGSQTNGLAEKVSGFFAIEVVYANPFAKVEAPAFLDPILKQSGPEFAVAVGPCIKTTFINMDNTQFQTSFIPKKPMMETPLHRAPLPMQRSVGILTVIAVVSLILVGGAYGGLYFYKSTLDVKVANAKKSLALAESSFEAETIPIYNF
jgi:cell division ATPase FtsA